MNFASTKRGFVEPIDVDTINERPLTNLQLRVSDRCAITFDADGTAILFHFAQPNRHLALTEPERVLMSCFRADRYTVVESAVQALRRQKGADDGDFGSPEVLASVRRLIEFEALVQEDDTHSPYEQGMVDAYLRSREIPSPVIRRIAKAGNIEASTRVLDVGTGTGSVAIQLAEYSNHVTGIDLSVSFLEAARRSAQARGCEVTFRLGCGNKVMFHDTEYDIITLSQSFHWLDRLWAAQGIGHALRNNGCLFALESKPVLPPCNPLRTYFAYGEDDKASIKTTAFRHASRYVDIFRVILSGFAISLTGYWLLRQKRRFDFDYARALLFTNQVEGAFPAEGKPWNHLQELFKCQGDDRLNGEMYWLLLRFVKHTPDLKPPRDEVLPLDIIDLESAAPEETLSNG